MCDYQRADVLVCEVHTLLLSKLVLLVKPMENDCQTYMDIILKFGLICMQSSFIKGHLGKATMCC